MAVMYRIKCRKCQQVFLSMRLVLRLRPHQDANGNICNNPVGIFDGYDHGTG
jgi:hypothetical protein